MLYYQEKTENIFQEFGSSERGLSDAQSAKQRKKYGANVIAIKGEPLWRKLIEPFANVFVGVLLGAVFISIFHHAYVDAVIIGAIILISAVIYYVQRFSTERILRALQKKNKLKVTVLRNDKEETIDASQLVPGDVIFLSEGEKVPADARVFQANSLRVDESQLTGESLPISKQISHISGKKEVYEQTNMVFQGSFIVGGSATAVVVKTGMQTEFGRLALLSGSPNESSPVQKKIDELVEKLIIIVAAISFVTLGLAMWRGMEISESIRFVMAIAVSAVPEGLPVAITVVLVLGMRRMAAKKALVRSMRAIETVGTLTTIATDKTGTLTKNKLTVREVWQPDFSNVKLINVVGYTINQGRGKVHDPLDLSLKEYVSKQKIKQASAAPLAVFPFDQSVSMSGNLWHHGREYLLYLKGAPEQILAHCELTESERETALYQLNKLTAQGYRVLAFAKCQLTKQPSSLSYIKKMKGIEFAGFIAVADILRPEAKRAIKTATAAGVTVRMVTGDHFETAYHIGKELGMIEHRNQVFDSRKMHVMNDDELEKIIDEIRVFSRVIPEHKHRLLTILKKKNVTAMTGDGVNDVPALTNAHVGVAMGSGTSIAKDAGDIILLNDNFKSIIDAIAEGRTIYSNIKRVVTYLLATNLGEVLVSLVALAFGMPIPLMPVQILWVNLVTDTLMALPLGLEPGNKKTMKQPPSHPKAPLLARFMVVRMVLIAVTMAITTLGLYAIFSNMYGVDYGRTVAFCTLVVMQWASAFALRSDTASFFATLTKLNPLFYVGLCSSVTLQLVAIFGPLAPFLHVHTITIGDMFWTGLFGFILTILVVDAHKWILYNLNKRHKTPTN